MPFRCRLTWKPWTASLVVASYTPVVTSGSHASWYSRLCSSRTCSPLSPGRSTTVGSTGSGSGVAVSVGVTVGLGEVVGVSTGTAGADGVGGLLRHRRPGDPRTELGSGGRRRVRDGEADAVRRPGREQGQDGAGDDDSPSGHGSCLFRSGETGKYPTLSS